MTPHLLDPAPWRTRRCRRLRKNIRKINLVLGSFEGIITRNSEIAQKIASFFKNDAIKRYVIKNAIKNSSLSPEEIIRGSLPSWDDIKEIVELVIEELFPKSTWYPEAKEAFFEEIKKEYGYKKNKKDQNKNGGENLKRRTTGHQRNQKDTPNVIRVLVEFDDIGKGNITPYGFIFGGYPSNYDLKIVYLYDREANKWVPTKEGVQIVTRIPAFKTGYMERIKKRILYRVLKYISKVGFNSFKNDDRLVVYINLPNYIPGRQTHKNTRGQK